MAEFVPINDDHAVESVTFQLVFSEAFSPAVISAVQANHHRWKNELPAGTNPSAFQFGNIAFGNVSFQPPGFPAAVFSHIRPDGSPAWQMRFEGNILTVTCSRYTRWARVWGAAKKLIESALAVLQENCAEGAQVVAAIILSVTDVFVASPQNYDLSSVLAQSEFISPKIQAAGPPWHNNLGWFEQLGEESILNNLNLSAAFAQAPGADGPSELRLTALHHQEIRFATRFEIGHVMEDDSAWLESRMANLHIANKQTVSALLVDAAAEKIGLNKSDGAPENA